MIKVPQVEWQDFLKESDISGAFGNRRRVIEETLQMIQNSLKTNPTVLEQLLGLIFVFFIDQKGI